MKKASEDPALKKYLGYTDEQVVSTDFISSTYSSVFDAALLTLGLLSTICDMA